VISNILFAVVKTGETFREVC